MAIFKKFTKRGFTLIELMIVVVIIGILAALAIYGVQKYVANSKSAEARQMLGRMSKDMLTFYEGENQNYQVLSLGTSAAISQALCPSTGNTVPSSGTPSKSKVQPSPDEFKDGAGWSCLGTLITTPIYYAYSVSSPEQGGTFSGNDLEDALENDTFTAIANGNLDGDTIDSTFRLGGAVKAGSTSGDLVLVLATTVEEINPEE